MSEINNSASGTSVTFGDSGSNSYADSISVMLSNSLAGGIAFTGTSTFAGGDATFHTVHGSITSTASSLIKTTAGSLTLPDSRATSTSAAP